MEQCRIIIIGAGLVGLASAIGVRKLGHTVLVLERSEQFSKISAGIAIPPNATKALANLDPDVLSALRDSALQPDNLIIRSARDGAVLANQPYVPDLLDKYQAPYFSAHRATFHAILLRRARSLGVEIKLGVVVTGIDFSGPVVHAGAQGPFAGDLILGADGENSQCRSLLLARPDSPQHAGDAIFAMDIPQHLLWEHDELREFVEPPNVNMWFGPDTHVVVFALREDGLVHVIGSRYESPSEKLQARPRPMDMDEVRRYFADWDPRLRRLLDIATAGTRWTLTMTPELRQIKHPAGKFALIGDSAHSMSPFLAQGAAMGIEDAAVLSALFAKLSSKSQIPDLLAIYEQLRTPRALELKRRSQDMRLVFALHDGPEQQERDRQLTQHIPFKGFPLPWMDPVVQEWLYGYDVLLEVDAAWEIYSRGEWPRTVGSWRLAK